MNTRQARAHREICRLIAGIHTISHCTARTPDLNSNLEKVNVGAFLSSAEGRVENHSISLQALKVVAGALEMNLQEVCLDSTCLASFRIMTTSKSCTSGSASSPNTVRKQSELSCMRDHTLTSILPLQAGHAMLIQCAQSRSNDIISVGCLREWQLRAMHSAPILRLSKPCILLQAVCSAAASISNPITWLLPSRAAPMLSIP